MSGQCLSPSETGHALTPANHLSLGRPLPHQQANSKQTAPRAINLWSGDIIRYYSRFRMAIPNPWVRIYSLLSLSPLSVLKINRSIFLKLLARLACLIHAANVHSEPGSNPSNDCLAVMSKLTTEQSERKVDPMHPSQDGCKDHTATVSNVNDQSFSVRLLLTRTES